MFKGNIKMAWAAIKSARWRSFLTMLGIIIGVVSVVTIVSLGEGVKRQVAGQINDTGSDIIACRDNPRIGRANPQAFEHGYVAAVTHYSLGDQRCNTVDRLAIAIDGDDFLPFG